MMLRVKKIRITQICEKYNFSVIYIFYKLDRGNRSINRTCGFNGQAVLSLAVRCNKDESSCKVYTCWKSFVSMFCLVIRNASNFITGCSTCERAAPSMTPFNPSPPPSKKTR